MVTIFKKEKTESQASINQETNKTAEGLLGMSSLLKGIDLNTVQNGVSSLQRVVGLLQELGTKSPKEEVKPAYKPRPIYKHFED